MIGGVGVRKHKSVGKVTITSYRGDVYVDSKLFSSEFRYPFWLFKINQKVLLPGFRRDHRKIIYIDGKRRGKADYREGCIPLPSYRFSGDHALAHLGNAFRELTGLGCSINARGYYRIKLYARIYIVVVRQTSDGYLRCIVYRKSDGEYIGDFLFDSAVTQVYPRPVIKNMNKVFSVIIGYLMDCLVYTTVSSNLNRKLEVVYK